MSRSFIGFGQKQYIGVPYIRPITLEGRMGQVVPLSLNWLAYGASSLVPNINVAVDLSINLVAAKLRQIRSIYIDNMGSDNPIYVYFPSTDYAVVAQPNSAGWFRAYATDYQLQVVGEGFTTGDIPTTKILVTNVDVSPAVDIEIAQAIALWKASASISRGNTIYNQNFSAPALGDKVTEQSLDVSTAGNVANVFTASPGNFLYVTGVLLNFFGLAGAFCNVIFEDTGLGGTIFQYETKNDGPVPFPPAQWKFDFSTTKRLRCQLGTGAAGFCQAIFTSTQNPT